MQVHCAGVLCRCTVQLYCAGVLHMCTVEVYCAGAKDSSCAVHPVAETKERVGSVPLRGGGRRGSSPHLGPQTFQAGAHAHCLTKRFCVKPLE